MGERAPLQKGTTQYKRGALTIHTTIEIVGRVHMTVYGP